ncbi:MAG: lytic transglycosylase domain-containing protein [Rhodospirillaceae bacterium]|nr:lytic transglycosylase domain-containing protein [Rhodospirillaceae bacterium]
MMSFNLKTEKRERPFFLRALVLCLGIPLALSIAGAVPVPASQAGEAKLFPAPDAALPETITANRTHLVAAGVNTGTNTSFSKDTEVAVLESTIPGITESLNKPGEEKIGTLPRQLSEDDIITYRKIFLFQKDGKWSAADREIKKLNDPILLGHVQAQRYLHPTKYRSKYTELRDWLKFYVDHPQAKRIYSLAMRRKPAKAKAPMRPAKTVYLTGGGTDPGSQVELPYVSRKKLTKNQKQQVNKIKSTVRRYVRRGSPTKAKEAMDASPTQKFMDRVEADHLLAKIAQGYFSASKDAEAFEIASKVAERSGKKVPRAYWTAGLAAWRLGRLETAAKYFETLAVSDTASGWNVAAAAYWAARAHLLSRHPEKVNHWLNIAALNGRTFYGLLARRNLGLPTFFNWAIPALTPTMLARFQAIPAGKRSLALIEAGRYIAAENELRKIYPSVEPEIAKAILAVAMKGNLPGLAMRIGTQWGGKDNNPNDGALSPAPGWAPAGGFSIDRALVYAIIRQESRFVPNAKSHAGARGLMQLMPRTASYLAKGEKFQGANRDKLFDPELNITLGEAYISQLLSNNLVQGNLFLLTVAYNGGPGNLSKWQRKTKYYDDPLLFIESIPSAETRNFIEKVLTNLWVYRQRLNQPAPSLDAIAAGEWPTYTPLDGNRMKLAKNAGSKNARH